MSSLHITASNRPPEPRHPGVAVQADGSAGATNFPETLDSAGKLGETAQTGREVVARSQSVVRGPARTPAGGDQNIIRDDADASAAAAPSRTAETADDGVNWPWTDAQPPSAPPSEMQPPQNPAPREANDIAIATARDLADFSSTEDIAASASGDQARLDIDMPPGAASSRRGWQPPAGDPIVGKEARRAPARHSSEDRGAGNMSNIAVASFAVAPAIGQVSANVGGGRPAVPLVAGGERPGDPAFGSARPEIADASSTTMNVPQAPQDRGASDDAAVTAVMHSAAPAGLDIAEDPGFTPAFPEVPRTRLNLQGAEPRLSATTGPAVIGSLTPMRPAPWSDDGSGAAASFTPAADGQIARMANTATGGPSVAGPAISSASDPPPVNVPEQVFHHVVGTAASGGGEVVLQLHPPELGELTVRVLVTGREVSAWFASPQAPVQQAISQAIAQLQSGLGSAGYNLAGAWVGADASSQRERDGRSPAPQQPRGWLNRVSPEEWPDGPGGPAASGMSIYV